MYFSVDSVRVNFRPRRAPSAYFWTRILQLLSCSNMLQHAQQHAHSASTSSVLTQHRHIGPGGKRGGCQMLAKP